MDSIKQIFDETKMRYIKSSSGSDHTCRIDDEDLKNIEMALIRFADTLAIAN